MMMQLSREAQVRLSALPVISRARGWRLYGADGKRYLDLWADGGRTVAGRRTGASGRVAKESIDRGLDAAFPSFWEERLRRAIRAWLPGYSSLRFFASETEALLALASADGDFAARMGSGASLPEALNGFAARLHVEAPFGHYRRDYKADAGGTAFDGRMAIAVLPLAGAWSFGVVLGKDPKDADEADIFRRISSSASVPAIKLATAARALADFRAFEAGSGEKKWSTIDPFIAGIFTRTGPWLYPAYPESEHDRIFSHCLEKGIVISPDYGEPSSVPGEFDAGEVAPLRSIRNP
ncbi:MAG: hypothetical protein Q8O15_02525 [Rectinemataceae bacterium]|nr:hypothetical protein [Rectinemataceae bacterium]